MLNNDLLLSTFCVPQVAGSIGMAIITVNVNEINLRNHLGTERKVTVYHMVPAFIWLPSITNWKTTL